ncbi:MAG: hypothetical protein H4O13_02810 [Xanthomonadales bacterium]|nr:hypothetical protein [Xanthomonadales bacterium]
MIIFLDKLVDAFDERDALALENLASAGRRGHHLISGDRSSLGLLAEHQRISEVSRALFRREFNKLATQGSFISSSPRLLVSNSDASNCVSLKEFSDHNRCGRCQLLAENLTDFAVLKGLASVLLGSTGFVGTVSFRPINGGGSTTAACLSQAIKDFEGPIVCVVDSDRKYPEGAIGGTARACRGVARKADLPEWLFSHIELECRELENIVPEDHIVAATQTHPETTKVKLRQALRCEEDFLRFACFKKGDSVCSMLSRARSDGNKRGEARLKSLPQSTVGPRIRCNACPNPDGCNEFPALGEKLLEGIAKALEDQPIKTEPQNWPRELLRALGTLVSFGIANEPIRV